MNEGASSLVSAMMARAVTFSWSLVVSGVSTYSLSAMFEEVNDCGEATWHLRPWRVRGGKEDQWRRGGSRGSGSGRERAKPSKHRHSTGTHKHTRSLDGMVWVRCGTVVRWLYEGKDATMSSKDVKEGKIPKRWWWVLSVVVQGSGPRMTTAPQNARCPTTAERYMGTVCGVGVQGSTINLDLDAQTYA